jgi:bifunctional DNA-binding transcriptional regulator/antitoxin component of YhaV-PrlF toxin-antitoxin module
MPLANPPGRLDVVYGFGRIDASGRVADRVTALGWRGGDRLSLTAEVGVLIARRDPGGMVTVPTRPYIVIPAALRRRYGLRAGDHVLLAAVPGQDLLAAYSFAVVDQAMRAHATVPGEGEIADLIWEAPDELTAEHARVFQDAMRAHHGGDSERAGRLWENLQAIWSKAWTANYAALEFMQGTGLTRFAPAKPQRWVVASFEHHTSPHSLPRPHIHNIAIARPRRRSRTPYRRSGMSIFILLLYSGHAVGKVAVRFRSSTIPQ